MTLVLTFPYFSEETLWAVSCTVTRSQAIMATTGLSNRSSSGTSKSKPTYYSCLRYVDHHCFVAALWVRLPTVDASVIVWISYIASEIGSGAFCFKACDPAVSGSTQYCNNLFDRVGCNYVAPASVRLLLPLHSRV